MNVLVTGATGFVGSHLCEYALKRGAEVYGAKRWRSSLDNIEHIKNNIHLLDGDLTDPLAVRKILEESKPDWVFNFAANSFVKSSFSQPREVMHTNIQSQINLLHGLKEGLCGQMLSCGSSEEYGLVWTDELPIKENNPLRPLSPYAVSKCATDLLAYQYFKSYGLKIIRTRAFNHSGPRRTDVFVESSIAKQIAELESKFDEKPGNQSGFSIEIGNMDSTRDFTDVRDTVRAYWLLMEKGKFGEVYNIASGHCDNGEPKDLKSWKISEIVNYLTAKSKLLIRTQQCQSRMRPSDVPVLIGDYTKLNDDTGWMPTIPFTKTLDDILEYWRSKIHSQYVYA